MADEQKGPRRSNREKKAPKPAGAPMAQYARKEKDPNDFLIVLRHDNVSRPEFRDVWFHDAKHQPDDDSLEQRDWTGVTCGVSVLPESEDTTGAVVQHVRSVDRSRPDENGTTFHKEHPNDPDHEVIHVFENWQVYKGKVEKLSKVPGDNWAIEAPHANKTSGTYAKTGKMYLVMDQAPYTDYNQLLPPHHFVVGLGMDEWDDKGSNWQGYGKHIFADQVPQQFQGKQTVTAYNSEQPVRKKRSVTIDWDKPALTRTMVLHWPNGLPENEMKEFKPDLTYSITIHNSPAKVLRMFHPSRSLEDDYDEKMIREEVWSRYFPHGIPPNAIVQTKPDKMAIKIVMKGNYTEQKDEDEGETDDGEADQEDEGDEGDDDDEGDDGKGDDEDGGDDGGDTDSVKYWKDLDTDDDDNDRPSKRPRTGIDDDDDVDYDADTEGGPSGPYIVEGRESGSGGGTQDMLMLGTSSEPPAKVEVSRLFDLSGAVPFSADVQALQAEQEAILDHEMAIKYQKGKYPSIRGRTYKGLTSWQCRAFKNKGKGPRCTQFTRERFPFCNFHSRHTGSRVDKRLNSYITVNGKKKRSKINSELVLHRNVAPGHLIGVVHSLFTGVGDSDEHKCKLDNIHDKARQYWSENYMQENEGQIVDTNTNLVVDFSAPNSSSVGRYATMVGGKDDVGVEPNAVAVLAKLKVNYQDCTMQKQAERAVVAMFADVDAGAAKGEEVVLKVYEEEQRLEVTQC